MSLVHAGNAQPSIDREEHWHPNNDEGLPGVKRSVLIDPVSGAPTNIPSILKQLLSAVLYPGWLDRSANQIRSQVTGTISTVTTVSTVTGITNMGSFSADHLQRMENINAWSNTVRSRIT